MPGLEGGIVGNIPPRAAFNVLLMSTIMNAESNARKFILPAAWLITAAVAFSFGRMTSWLSEPVANPDALPAAGGVPGGSSAGDAGVGAGVRAGSERVGSVFTAEPGALRTGTVSEVTGGQPMEDWLTKVMAQEDDLYRMQQFLRLLETIDNVDDIKAALKIVGANRGSGRGASGSRMTEFGMLMAKFAQIDPKAAMAYAGEQEGGQRFAATFSALRSWTKMAPDAALAWAQTEGPNFKMDFGRGRDSDDGPQLNFALMGVLSQLARTDLGKAMNVASTTEFGDTGSRAVDGLASELVSQRGAAAARDAAANLPEGSFKNQLIQRLADRLSRTDPEATADWVMRSATGDTQRRALGEAMNNWAGKDPAAAGAFLAAQQASPQMDSAISEYARAIAKAEPAKAWEWAQTIQDAERKTATLGRVASDWMRTDAPSAQQAIAASPLPDDVKKKLSQQGQGSGRGGPRGAGGGR